MDADDFDIDALDATFIGLGAYLNEKEQIPEEETENLDQNEFKQSNKTNIVQRIPRKRPLRLFEQYVQDSINKLKRR